MKVAPSILSADFNHLLDDVKRVECADYLHIDVMDGHFVPNISFGTTVYKNLRKNVTIPFDVHLMIDDPLFYAEDFVKSGADYLTFHYECKNNPIDVINKFKELGVKVGISIKPKTKPEEIKDLLPLVDLVLVMSVEPGFGGQSFMSNALDKIKYLDEYRKDNNLNYLIEVDGGINYENALACHKQGCDIVVAGTYVFKSNDPVKTIKEMQEIWDI